MMKKYLSYAFLLISVSIFSCKTEDKKVASAILNSTSNNAEIGKVEFFQMSDGKIKMDMEINFPEKADSSVAVHFHEHGDCGNMGENTHGHWNPTNEQHGKWDSESFHSGDIGNISLDNKGYAKISLSSSRWNVAANDPSNIIGRGIIVHGGVDDYETQPTGNSGPRIGCGVITAIK
jgi:Cu-Zn family superoxide dismutase